jgi:hypothetical protein
MYVLIVKFVVFLIILHLDIVSFCDLRWDEGWRCFNLFSMFEMAVTEEAEGDGWKAEEAIAGNRKALQGLRELLLWPLLYSREATILGLRVNKFFTIIFCITLS